MNGKQAARAAAKRIAELEDFNRRCSNDIKALYTCIDSVIAGEKCYCDWCEEESECCQPEKKQKTGCENFWMKQNHGIVSAKGDESENDTKGISSASGVC